MTNSVEHSVHIEATPDAVWVALTVAAQLEQWYAPGCRWEVPALKPGAILGFYNTETDIQRAHVEAAIPSRELTLSWEVVPEHPHIRLRNTFSLAPVARGTQVTVSQHGYEALPGEDREAWWKQDQQAMVDIARGLKAHVERQRSAAD